MPKKKEKPLKMTLEVDWTTGLQESIPGDPSEIRSRFKSIVSRCCENYIDSLKEIRLIDNAGHVFKSFHQYF